MTHLESAEIIETVKNCFLNIDDCNRICEDPVIDCPAFVEDEKIEEAFAIAINELENIAQYYRYAKIFGSEQEICNKCKHGYFNDSTCYDCCFNYKSRYDPELKEVNDDAPNPSHYEMEEGDPE